MMSIDEEIESLYNFLQHPAGFNVDMAGILNIRPIDECSPPVRWEVDWQIKIDHMICKYHKTFDNLREAVIFFVEKRRYNCWGLDFEKIELEELKDD